MRTNRIKKPSDLERVRLLATNTRPCAWADWFKATSTVLDNPPEIAESFDHFYLQIQAAKCGLGVAAVPRMLVRDELDSAGLVAPFGFVPGPVSLVLWVAPHAESQPKTVALVEWLRSELQKMEG
jgi:DNA-binding transcriptional LysR family regulator